jgi:hypothetical protein
MPENSTACGKEKSGKSRGKPGRERRIPLTRSGEIQVNQALISEVLRVIKNSPT